MTDLAAGPVWRLSPHESLVPGFLVSLAESAEAMASAEAAAQEIVAVCIRSKGSDFDVVPNRPVAFNTGNGLVNRWNALSQSHILALIAVFYSWKFQTLEPEIRRQRLEELEVQMLRHRAVDFGCTLPMAAGGGPVPRLRVHGYICELGVALTCRVLAATPPEYDKLGLPDSVVQTLMMLLQKKSGLGLVTGPTGSGKTSTLAAFIHAIRMQLPRKIVTIEDPIEILYSEGEGLGSVIQQEVGRDVATFGAGLHAVLRKRPDIILLGEIRDAESMQTCLEATQTGHLILATLHTRGVASTLRRITEFFPPDRAPQILSACSESLLFVLSQGLLPKVGSEDRVLACEFMVNKDSSRVAIAKYLSTPQALRETIKKPHNVEWNANVRSLLEHDLIGEKEARDALLEEGPKADA